MWSLNHPNYWSRGRATVCCLMAGFQGLPLCYPLAALLPLCLLTLSVRMAPFSGHHTAGTAFAVNSLWIEIYGVGKGRRPSDRQGDREEEMGGREGGFRKGEKWMTESKIETQTFAELRLPLLWPRWAGDRHENGAHATWFSRRSC